MAIVIVFYDLDLGSVGTQEVEVTGNLERDMLHSIKIDITEVTWRVGVQTVDIYSQIRQADLDAMRNRLRNEYLTQYLRGRESAGEVVA